MLLSEEITSCISQQTSLKVSTTNFGGIMESGLFRAFHKALQKSYIMGTNHSWLEAKMFPLSLVDIDIQNGWKRSVSSAYCKQQFHL